MSLISKLVKGGYGFVTSKGIRKNVGNVKDAASKGLVRTTTQATQTATSGGRKIAREAAQNVAKGAGSIGKVGGAVVAGTAITAIPTMTGLGLFNQYRKVTTKTDAQHIADNELDILDRMNDIMTGHQGTGDHLVDNDPTRYGNTGVGGNKHLPVYSDYFKDDTTPQSEEKGNAGLWLLGAAALGVGAFYAYNKKKKGKTSSKK